MIQNIENIWIFFNMKIQHIQKKYEQDTMIGVGGRGQAKSQFI